MKIRLMMAVMLLLMVCSLSAQKRPLNETDYANWKRLENRQITNNGDFISYEINKQKGDGKLIVFNTKTNSNDTLYRASEARFAYNSAFVAYRVKAAEDTVRRMKLAKVKKEKLPKDTLCVMDLATKQTSRFPKVVSYRMPDEKCAWMAFTQDASKEPEDTTKVKRKKEEGKELKKESKKESKPAKNLKKTSEKDLYDFSIYNPLLKNRFKFSRVESYTLSTKGNYIAFTTKLSDTTNVNAVVLFNAQTQKIDTVFRDSVFIKRLTLDESGSQLAFMASGDTTKVKSFALYYAPLNKFKLNKVADEKAAFLPKNWIISDNGNVTFSPDGSKLYLGTCPKPKPEVKDTLLEDEVARLDLWSYTDSEIQPMQLKNAEHEKKRTYLAVYRVKDNKLIQLADTVTREVRLISRTNGEWGLGIDNREYKRSVVWSSRELADYYLIDLKTGARKQILKGRNNVALSPGGKYTLWFDFNDQAYYCMDNKSQKTVNLTGKLGVKFCDEDNDIPSDPAPYGTAGWTENDEQVLIYDRFDLWKCDPTAAKPAINLTNGRAATKRYRYVSLDEEEVCLSVQKPWLMTVFNESTNDEGYSRLTPADGKLKTLLEGKFMLGTVAKAKNAEQVIWATQTVKDYPEVKWSDLSFTAPKTISTTNPQQTAVNWLTVEFVNWKSFAGDSLKGLLYKPENFDPNKKYPMMVYYYEKNSETSNRYVGPSPSRSTINVPFYCSNGYLVFVPDIVYKIGYPGQSAYDAIVSGVYHLMEKCPYLNAKKMGLQGQSWGGYQTAYLITQTDLFAAAEAGAPVSNMTSAYGGIRWGTGNSRMFQYEQTQSRIGGTLWDKPMNYIENSPVFMAPRVKTPLMIMSNDNDGAVPWYQGIEYFMALYRLNKPVWLVNYNGMEHNLEAKYWANRMDLSKRLFTFFNHFLKDEPAPEWMKQGIPAIEKGKNLGF